MKIKKNGKVIKLTESDLKKIVKKVLVTEAMAAEDQIILSNTPPIDDVGAKKDYYIQNDKDVVTGYISPQASARNAKKHLKVYEFNLKSPIQGCQAKIVTTQKNPKLLGFNVKDSIASHPASGSNIGYNIEYSLSNGCKRGIYNAQQKQGGDHVVDVGTVSVETNGGDFDTKVRFVGKMKSTGSKTGI